jgi:tetratricopeptide (TPR) repeat protein
LSSAAYRLLITGQYDEAIELANLEIARATEAGSDAAVGLMLVWRGLARTDMGDADGLLDVRDAVRILDEQAHPMASMAAYNLGVMLDGLGRLREASEAFDTVAAAAHRSGSALGESGAAIALAMIAFHRGEAATARASLDSVKDVSELGAAEAANVLGRLLLDEQPSAAVEAARQALSFGRATDNPQKQCDALALAARAELAMGDAVAANASLGEFLEAWPKTGGTNACAPALVDAGLVLAAYDRHDELAAATKLLRGSTPWIDAARALAERRYSDAAAILDSIPSIPLRDAALRLAAR